MLWAGWLDHPPECSMGLWPGSHHAAKCPMWDRALAQVEADCVLALRYALLTEKQQTHSSIRLVW